MTKLLAAVLLLLFLPTNIMFAQDDVAKKLIDALERITTLKDEIAELKEANNELTAENEKLKEELAGGKGDTPKNELKGKKEEGDAATPGKDKKVVAPVGATWKGKFGGANTESAEMSVTKREGKTITLKISIESGAVWEFDCEFTGTDSYKINDTHRLQASRGIVNPAPVGGIKGKGTITAKKLVHRYRWKRTGEPDADLAFIGDLVEDKK